MLLVKYTFHIYVYVCLYMCVYVYICYYIFFSIYIYISRERELKGTCRTCDQSGFDTWHPMWSLEYQPRVILKLSIRSKSWALSGMFAPKITQIAVENAINFLFTNCHYESKERVQEQWLPHLWLAQVESLASYMVHYVPPKVILSTVAKVNPGGHTA